MTYLKFAIPNYYLLTGTILLASIQPAVPEYKLHKDLYISIPVITVITELYSNTQGTHIHVISHICYQKKGGGWGGSMSRRW